jgi:hypothetical protein
MDEETMKKIAKEFWEKVHGGLEEWNLKRIWEKPTQLEQLSEPFISELLRVEDSDLVYKFLDCVTGIIGKRWSDELAIVTRMPEGFIYLWAIEGVRNEVFNGGYNQYFFNSASVFADIALKAFRTVGADKLARIHEAAISTMAENADKLEPYFKDRTMDAFFESYNEKIFDHLTDEFYSADKQDLDGKLVHYIRSNPDKFVAKS